MCRSRLWFMHVIVSEVSWLFHEILSFNQTLISMIHLRRFPLQHFMQWTLWITNDLWTATEQFVWRGQKPHIDVWTWVARTCKYRVAAQKHGKFLKCHPFGCKIVAFWACSCVASSTAYRFMYVPWRKQLIHREGCFFFFWKKISLQGCCKL